MPLIVFLKFSTLKNEIFLVEQTELKCLKHMSLTFMLLFEMASSSLRFGLTQCV